MGIWVIFCMKNEGRNHIFHVEIWRKQTLLQLRFAPLVAICFLQFLLAPLRRASLLAKNSGEQEWRGETGALAGRRSLLPEPRLLLLLLLVMCRGGVACRSFMKASPISTTNPRDCGKTCGESICITVTTTPTRGALVRMIIALHRS